MSDNLPLCASHEDRLQGLESFHNQMAGAMAEMTERLKTMGERLDEVGEAVDKGLASLQQANDAAHDGIRKEVEGIKKQSEEQGRQVTLLLGARVASEKRIAALKKVGGVLFISALGGVATKWGETIVSWLTGR